ncbi:MAG TPA: hypothetical protein VD866_01145 [Urbifossiella sp.]|nr:hypothetical protein [Urbifossiella sp.]
MPDPDVMNPPLPPADAAVAAALARLRPAPAPLDRDRLMFAAGAESRRNVVRLWQFAAGILMAAGFAAGVLYAQSALREVPAVTAPR